MTQLKISCTLFKPYRFAVGFTELSFRYQTLPRTHTHAHIQLLFNTQLVRIHVLFYFFYRLVNESGRLKLYMVIACKIPRKNILMYIFIFATYIYLNHIDDNDDDVMFFFSFFFFAGLFHIFLAILSINWMVFDAM